MKPSLKVRHLVLSVLVAASAAALPAMAQISFNINLAPPAPLVEARPVIAPGYVWAPGYWTVNGDRHVWVRGRSIVQRQGYVWSPDRWEQRGTVYVRQPGNWQRDVHYKAVKVEKPKKPKHWNNGHGNKNKHDDNGKRRGKDKHDD
ncbi:MAG: YXWGXW repeat-containing protein [Rhodoferax sp.]